MTLASELQRIVRTNGRVLGRSNHRTRKGARESSVLTPLRTTGLSLHGSRYDFIVEATPSNRRFLFHLRAIDRATGRWSIINTVNAVMSELLAEKHDPSDLCWSETPWGVTPDDCARLVTTAVQLLTDQNSLERIEAALDEDRAEGEWRAN